MEMLSIAGLHNPDGLKRHMEHMDKRIVSPFARPVVNMKCYAFTSKWNWAYGRLDFRKAHFAILEIVPMDNRSSILNPELRYSALPDNELIGESLFPIFPVLWRVDDEGENDVLISKGWIAVKLQY
ncbi:hypothetical protein N7478_007729 [Penicillium angulare]|uniref:uncharacterized protein n=1 Tax=Penicillium angulare TaxID=116970 RepID=UPI0025407CD7|nr:uncharacterized protein N7478_007729 [Penicillium angulare]KAJ5272604.1 hypothetical protein N7478_007729 [Penicillium angulare]